MFIQHEHTRCNVSPQLQADGEIGPYVDVTVTVRVRFGVDDDLKQSSIMQFVVENLDVEI